MSRRTYRQLARALKRHVDGGAIAGAGALIFRNGAIEYRDAIGLQDVERGLPKRADSIFRIASMTKPITAAAAMILVEEGTVGLDDAVDAWLPELARRSVLRDPAGPLGDVVEACRSITLRDLLTFRLGIGMPAADDGTPIAQAVRDAGLVSPRLQTLDIGPDEWMKRLGALPLAYQPGQQWSYHLGSEVLGVLIARATKMSLSEYLASRLLGPLGMKDTGFFVPSSEMNRFAANYVKGRGGAGLKLHDEPRQGRWSAAPAFESGGGGLVATLDDYLRFSRALLDGGVFQGRRILSTDSVALMTTNHLTAEQRSIPFFFDPHLWETRGFGFGMAVSLRPDANGSSVGTFGWEGAFGTQWICDPVDGSIGILMIQRVLAALQTEVCAEFQRWVRGDRDEAQPFIAAP